MDSKRINIMLLDDYHPNIEALKGISKMIKINGFDLNF